MRFPDDCKFTALERHVLWKAGIFFDGVWKECGGEGESEDGKVIRGLVNRFYQMIKDGIPFRQSKEWRSDNMNEDMVIVFEGVAKQYANGVFVGDLWSGAIPGVEFKHGEEVHVTVTVSKTHKN